MKRPRLDPAAWLARHRLVRDAIRTSLFTVIGRSAGLLIPFFIAAWYGVQASTDAFFLGYAIILMLQSIFIFTLETVSVPLFRSQIARGEDLGAFAGRLLLVGSAVILALLLAALLLLLPLLPVITRFSPATLGLLASILWEIAPLVVLTFWSGILSGILNASKRFTLPALSPLVRALAVLLTAYALRSRLGVHGIILGYVLGEFCRCLVFFVRCRRIVPIRFAFDLRFSRQLLDFSRIAGYQMITGIAGNVNLAVDRMMAARLGEGQVSLLHYADRLYLVPMTLFLGGVLMPVLSHWSEKFEREGVPSLRRDLTRSLRLLAPAALAVSGLGIALRRLLAGLAYRHGQFPTADLERIETVFAIFLIGLTPGVLLELLSRAMLILKKTRSLMLGALATVSLNIACNLLFMSRWGVAGIALSTSLVQVVYLLFLWSRFQRHSRGGEARERRPAGPRSG